MGDISAVKLLYLRQYKSFKQEKRVPMEISAGPHLVGNAHPHPDIADPSSRLIGALKRFCFRPPTPDPTWMDELELFVQTWCEKNMTPISGAQDVTFETWIGLTPYTQKRKDELKKLWAELGASEFDKIPKNRRNVKSFTKKETYKFTYKHHRTINGRDDAMKIFFGPIFKAIEKELFARDEFIKKIPVKDRPTYIYERLFKLGATYFCSDYSSFESLFTPELMKRVENILYKHMTKHMQIGPEFIRAVATVLLKANIIDAGHYSLIIEATRMSGEMNTSLGNGFANLMIILFICMKLGTEVVPCVEGDDNMSRIIGPVPQPEHFAKLGLVIKTEVYDTLEDTSFCGQIFAEAARDVLTDPRDVLSSIGWVDGKYAGGKESSAKCLLRAKAWSYGYQYEACPIISAAARAMLRLTASYDQRKILTSLDSHKRELYEEAFKAGRPELNRTPHQASRLLIESKYNIPVAIQLRYENYFDNLNHLEPIPNYFNMEFPDSEDFFNRFVVETSNDPRLMNYPPEDYAIDHQVKVPIIWPSMDEDTLRHLGRITC